MSSLIANQVRTNLCLVSIKNSLLFSLLLCHYSPLTDTTILITITARPTQLFTILLTTLTVLLELHTQLVIRLLKLQLIDWSLYLAFLYINSLLLLVYVFDLFVYTVTPVDIVANLPITITRHLSVLVFLCNKFVIVVAIDFVYCS